MDAGAAPVPTEDIVASVDRLRQAPQSSDELVPLLDERSPIYAGKSETEAERIRGYVLASFEKAGLPDAATAYAREELQSGRNPYTVAAAAKALRHGPVDAALAPLLVAAVERLRPVDIFVSYEAFSPEAAGRPSTTAVVEVLRTLAALGPLAAPVRSRLAALAERSPPLFSPSVEAEVRQALAAMIDRRTERTCCNEGEERTLPEMRRFEAADLLATELQDEAGATFSFRDFFAVRPSVLAFFYTRCGNPEKCSLTITKLARLQRALRDAGLEGRVRVAAMSYDPAFDLPHRLRTYGIDRGMRFNGDAKLLRTVGPIDPVARHFGLGVGYGPATVNRHRIELYFLDRSGRVVNALTRRQWSVAEVCAALATLVTAEGAKA